MSLIKERNSESLPSYSLDYRLSSPSDLQWEWQLSVELLQQCDLFWQMMRLDTLQGSLVPWSQPIEMSYVELTRHALAKSPN